MTTNKYPSLNNIYATFIILVGISTGGLFLYFSVQESIDAPTSMLIMAFAILAIAGSLYSVYSAARISGDEVRYKLGQKADPMAKRHQIKTIGYGIH